MMILFNLYTTLDSERAESNKTFTVSTLGDIDSTITWITPATFTSISANYISNSYPDRKIKLYMIPTSKYYVSPLTACVEEKDRINMLQLLLKYVKKK